jgi:UTP:GlnB (protein PII) uridylyltransferase
MPKLDIAEGLAPGIGPSDEQIHAYFRRYLPDFYFVNTPLSRMRRHLALLGNLAQRHVQIDYFQPQGAQFTELVLCAYDDALPGLLSKVAGTLAALKIEVHTAWIHTLADPFAPESEGRVVLDTLIVSEPYFRRTRAITPKTQKHIAATLAEVLKGESDVPTLLAKTHRRMNAPLLIHDLMATRVGAHTLIKLNAADDEGILYRVTRGLTHLKLNIAHAQINTFDKNVDDVFFVSNDKGEPLSDVEIDNLLPALRNALSNDSILDHYDRRMS